MTESQGVHTSPRGETGDEPFRAMVENLPQLVWAARPDGCVDYYNRGWYAYTGTTFEQMQGWGWERVHDPEMLPQVVEQWQRSLTTGEPFDMEFPLRGADGVFRWFLSRGSPLRDAGGSVLRWFGTNTNIDALRQRKELVDAQAVDRMKDEFLSGLSYQLGSPLHAIVAQVNVLNATGPSRTQQGFLQRIVASSEVLLALVNDLLDMSRLRAGRFTLHVDDIALGPLISKVWATLSPLAEQQALRVVMQIPSDLPKVRADEQRVEQVLVSVIYTAIKMASTAGMLRISVEARGPEVRFEARHTGKSLSAEDIPKIFQQFKQIGGAWLGVSVTKTLVEEHGGRIGIEPERGDGNTFWFTLPRKRDG